MTKPGFILKRTKLLFESNDETEISVQQQVYQDYIDKRNEQLDQMCYCGHTIFCDCGNPSFEEFKNNLIKNNIKEQAL